MGISTVFEVLRIWLLGKIVCVSNNPKYIENCVCNMMFCMWSSGYAFSTFIKQITVAVFITKLLEWRIKIMLRLLYVCTVWRWLCPKWFVNSPTMLQSSRFIFLAGTWELSLVQPSNGSCHHLQLTNILEVRVEKNKNNHFSGWTFLGRLHTIIQLLQILEYGQHVLTKVLEESNIVQSQYFWMVHFRVYFYAFCEHEYHMLHDCCVSIHGV